MSWLMDVLKNPFLIVPVSTWIISQVSKVVIYWIINKKLEIERMFGDGGMPSAHASTVCSLAAYTGIAFGLGSFEFAFTFIFALVVCRDAMGVRRESGKQAALLNEMRKNLSLEDMTTVKLKEFVGHTPLQVIIGGVIGIVNAVLLSLTLF